MTDPYQNISANHRKSYLLMYFLVVLTTSLIIANLNAITDFVLHPDIPYFDEEHLIVGGISGVLTAVILTVLAISHFKLKRNDLKIKSLNMALENKVEERTEELKNKNQELLVIEGKLLKQLGKNIAAQEELHQSKMLLKAIIDNSFEMQGLLTLDGKLIEVNKTSLDLIGVGKETVIDRYFWETPWWGHNPALQDKIREAIGEVAAGEFLRFETENQDAKGNIHLIDFSLKPVLDDQGNIIFLMPEWRDVTDYRKLENQLLQQQKLDSIGLLAGGIAHDFNNLLTPILGYSELICSKVSPDDPIHADSVLIWDAANCASGLIKQLLSFSRKQDLATHHYDMNEIISSFGLMLRRTIREDIEIMQVLSTDTCEIVADRNQIEQVLLNLAVNSQCAINGAGTITIETGHLILDDEFCHFHPGSTPGPYVLLAFSDTGSGIPGSILPHIFEPFFSTSSTGPGKGLGLYSVYSIVRQHDGFIDVHSKDDQGTTFCIYLPESISGDIDVNQPAIAAIDTLPVQPRKIMLVEDNAMVLDMTKNLLENQGHTVWGFLKPEDALEYARTASQTADLLLSDVVMPVMNGLELYEKLEKIIPDLKVLFMSGYTTSKVLQQQVSENRANFIPKPFTTETLAKKIAEIMQQGMDIQLPQDISG